MQQSLERMSVALCDMPLFHLAGLYTMVRSPLQAGATVLLSRQFDPTTTLSVLGDATLAVTHYFSVPQMAATLWSHLDFEPRRLRNLVSWTIGGAPNPKAQSERFLTAGIPISEGFGMSETGSNFAMPPHDVARALSKAGSCGTPLLSIEARIIDDEGHDVSVGECGELLIRGPSVCMGYWNQPELTANAFLNGWFRTGDAAKRDSDGYYFIVDRKKDMFISGGENVYPAEIEAVLAELPEVAESAVVAVPDARWGEVGRVYVIPAAGHMVSPEHILSFCAARLAKYKIPQSAVITEAIPRTASGKVQKHLLRDQALRELEM
jgi:fatty-acyl-CoA synthase